MVLIVTAYVHSFYMHVQLFSGNRCLQFCPSLYLRLFFEHASCEDSDETAHMRSLVRAFLARICDKYRNLMNWHKPISYYIITGYLSYYREIPLAHMTSGSYTWLIMPFIGLFLDDCYVFGQYVFCSY